MKGEKLLFEKQIGIFGKLHSCIGEQMTIIMLDPIKDKKTLPMDALIAVGFGVCTVEKGRELIYEERPNGIDNDPTLEKFELMAIEDPDHDWRISFISPLSEAHYQRQGVGNWVLVEEGPGFA